jgi:putative alpha-1,2-mannosidase
MYKPMPDGHCGDEDNGQICLVCIGIGVLSGYAGINQYVLGAPLFKSNYSSLENGKGCQQQITVSKTNM